MQTNATMKLIQYYKHLKNIMLLIFTKSKRKVMLPISTPISSSSPSMHVSYPSKLTSVGLVVRCASTVRALAGATSVSASAMVPTAVVNTTELAFTAARTATVRCVLQKLWLRSSIFISKVLLLHTRTRNNHSPNT